MNERNNPSTPDFPVVFKGLNELEALVWGVMLPLFYAPIFLGGFHALGFGLIALNLFIALGNRYRCEVDTTGIYLVRRIFYILPIERRKFLLDAWPEFYDLWDCAQTQGVFLSVWGSEESESEVFGPHFSERAQRRLRDALAAAIAAARSVCPPAPGHLRASPLNHHLASIQVVKRYYDGSPATAITLAPLPLMGMQIPANSTLHFAQGRAQRWRDPRREDRLTSIDCAGETVLPWGQRIQAGARLYLDFTRRHISVERGFDGPVFLDGRRVAGHKLLKFGPRGELRAYTLAEPVTVRRLAVLPAGSAVAHQQLRRGLEEVRVELSAPTYIKDRYYRAHRSLLLRPPWHLSRYTFGLWRPKVALEEYKLDRNHHELQKIMDSIV